MVKKVNSSPKIMVRFSEIGIKSAKTRKWLTKRLIRHIEYVLKLLGVGSFQVINKYSRIFILTAENINLIGKGLSRLVPGIASLSFVYQTTSNIEEIKNTVKTIFLKEIREKNSFAVKTKRIGTHSYSSVELSAEIGEYILNNMDKKIHVNLDSLLKFERVMHTYLTR
ncbi:MAG: THUMP domain-containing protein [Candidatus Heimdallarchaeaceae archaeon]